jgi:hypothetical protein
LVRATRNSDHPQGAITLVEPRTALVCLDELIELARKLHRVDPDFEHDRLIDLLCDRAAVLENDDQHQASIAAYKEAIILEGSTERGKLLREIVEVLE